MLNPLDVAKEIKAMADVLAAGKLQELPKAIQGDILDLAAEIWEKVYAINNCPNCDMEDPEDAWKHGNPEHDPENN